MIISGFAGIGKTYFAKNRNDVIDLESTNYKWIYPDNIKDKIEERKNCKEMKPNPNWPMNYYNDILKYMNEKKYVLISPNYEIRLLLKANNIDYCVVFPNNNCKEEYLKRYKKRNNNENFINALDINFDLLVDSLKEEENIIILEENQYLSDIFN